MTLTPAKVGGWAFGDFILHDEITHLQSELVKAIDGTGGGAYTLHDADLTLATDNAKKFILNLAAQLDAGNTLTIDDATILVQGVSGRLNLTAGSAINIFHGAVLNLDGNSGGATISTELGSLIDVFGLLKIEAGGQISIEPSGVATLKGTMNVIAGGLVDVFGSITLDTGGFLDVLAASNGVNFDAGAACVLHQAADLKISDVGNTNAGSWSSNLTAHYAEVGWFQSVGASQYWQQSDVGSARRLQFDLGGLLQGDQIVSIDASVNVQAFHSGLFGFTLPKLSLFRLDAFGVRSDIATRSDQSGTIGAYETQHNIFMDASNLDSGLLPHTLTGGRYYLELTGETGTNSINDALQLLSIVASTKQRSFRVPSEVG